MTLENNQFCLNGKKAMITGASRGIGFAIARSFALQGADLMLVSRNEDNLRLAQKKLLETGRHICIQTFDTTQIEKIPEFYNKACDQMQEIDILVNNAGGSRRGAAETISIEDWLYVIHANLTSVFFLSQAFARQRIAKGKKGKIINIASMTSEGARPGNSVYGASKGGIRQLTKGLAVDWAKYGINVNALGPGYIKTEMTKPLWQDTSFDLWVKNRTPFGRWGTPEDLTGAAVFLASPASDFVTGHILYVDGGWLSTF